MAPTNTLPNATQVARIAVYDDLLSAPRVVDIPPSDVATYIEAIASNTYELASSQGGTIPYTVIREVSENFIHAQFKEITVSIMNRGCTIRFADQGPGIDNKDRAQMPGFSSASKEMKEYIRGVGSGLPIVKEYLKFSNGRLVIEDNIKDGTVITIAVDQNASASPVVYQEAPATAQASWTARPQEQPASWQTIAAQPQQPSVWGTSQPSMQPKMQPDAAAHTPAYAPAPEQVVTGASVLDDRDLSILIYASENPTFGPTDVSNALGLSAATAYRSLNKLQNAGFLMEDTAHKGKRTLTQLGLQTLREQV